MRLGPVPLAALEGRGGKQTPRRRTAYGQPGWCSQGGPPDLEPERGVRDTRGRKKKKKEKSFSLGLPVLGGQDRIQLSLRWNSGPRKCSGPFVVGGARPRRARRERNGNLRSNSAILGDRFNARAFEKVDSLIPNNEQQCVKRRRSHANAAHLSN